MIFRGQKGSILVKLLIFIAAVGLVAVIEIPRVSKDEAEKEMWHCRESMLNLQRAENKYYSVHKEYSSDIDSLSSFLQARNHYFKGMADSLKSFLTDTFIAYDENRDRIAKVDSLRTYLEGERSAYIDTLVDLRNLLLTENARVKSLVDSLKILKEETGESYEAEIDSFRNSIDYIESYPAEVEGFSACLDSVKRYFPIPLEAFCPTYPFCRYDLEVLADKVYIKCFYEEEHGKVEEGDANW